MNQFNIQIPYLFKKHFHISSRLRLGLPSCFLSWCSPFKFLFTSKAFMAVKINSVISGYGATGFAGTCCFHLIPSRGRQQVLPKPRQWPMKYTWYYNSVDYNTSYIILGISDLSRSCFMYQFISCYWLDQPNSVCNTYLSILLHVRVFILFQVGYGHN
jgi:hypothetical protein